MKLNKPGLDLIKNQEGFVSCPYLDSVKMPTVGYGTTMYPNGEGVKIGDSCVTRDQALVYLQHHVEKAVIASVSSLIQKPLNDNQADAIISLVYNIGSGNFKKSSVLRQINVDPNDKAKITTYFMMWVKAGGQTLPGLVARRKKELQLYFS